MRILLAIAAIPLMAGCAAPREAFYEAQRDYRAATSAKAAAQASALQTAAVGCADDTCRVAIAGFAALARSESVAAPQQYRSNVAPVLDLIGKALGIGAQVYGQQLQGESLVDLAGVIAGSAGDRSTHSFIDQSNNSDNSTHIADSWNSEAGDTISDSGNTTISESNNGNAGRDLIGGDRVDNSGNIGEGNRQGSDGPIDQSDDGDDCSGESCNPVTPAEPIDP